MEEDNTTMTFSLSIVSETIAELEGKVEQLLAAPSIIDEEVAKTTALIESLAALPHSEHRCITMS
eukprot:6263837-Ditylum_brightwellii.AAC.1